MNKVRITYLVLSAFLGIFPGFVAKVKAQIITGGFSYEGSITISPESPVADWRPMYNDENQPLFSGDSARLTVVIDDGDSEKYERVKGPDVTIPYSNGLWAVSSISESQVVLAATNTGNSGSGIQTATVTTQWKKKGSGGGGGGPGGGGDSLINGIAIGIAEVGVLAGDWSFSDRLQKADRRSPISVSLEVTGGGALVRFNPQEMEPFELTPADAAWTIDTPPPPVTGTTRSWSYVANVTSETPTEGKMKLPFNTGGELRSSSLLQFAIVDLQVESGPTSGSFLKEELNTNGSNATPPHEITPGGILPVVPIPPEGESVSLDGKLLKIRIVLDDNAKKNGRVKLETEAGATNKVIVYTGSNGAGPLTFPMEYQVSEIPSELYVRATSSFNVQGFLKLTYYRDFILPTVTAHLDDAAAVLSVEVIELAPEILDENGNVMPNSQKPSRGLPLTPFVENNPIQDRIAHRELNVKIGSGELNGKKVTFSMIAVPNTTPTSFRGKWQDSQNHPDRFETSATYGAHNFQRISQEQGESRIDGQGFTAIRANVPPIAYNKPRIRIKVEDCPQIDLIDMEVPGIVVIDPGHGGNPSGPQVGGSDPDHAVCPSPPGGSGSSERVMTLELGLMLRDRLQTLRTRDHLNLRVHMTRTTDVNSALATRANFARNNGADVLISLHFNDFNKIARGTETYYDSTGNLNQAQDEELAGRVNTAVFGAIAAHDAGAINRGVKGKGLDVLSDPSLGNSQNYHPVRAVLLETEFIDVPAVDQLLNTNSNHQQVRQAIIDALGDALQDDLMHNPQ